MPIETRRLTALLIIGILLPHKHFRRMSLPCKPIIMLPPHGMVKALPSPKNNPDEWNKKKNPTNARSDFDILGACNVNVAVSGVSLVRQKNHFVASREVRRDQNTLWIVFCCCIRGISKSKSHGGNEFVFLLIPKEGFKPIIMLVHIRNSIIKTIQTSPHACRIIGD